MAFIKASILKPKITYIYTYIDSNNKIITTNLPPSSVIKQKLTLKNVTLGYLKCARNDQKVDINLKHCDIFNLIDEVAIRENIDPSLVRAIVETESSFCAKARSITGASGLMQLMPQTAKRFDVTDLFDPRQNLIGGTRYLKWLLNNFNGDWYKAIAAYNAGEGAVAKYNGMPPFLETRAYVPKVLNCYSKYCMQSKLQPKSFATFLDHKRYKINKNTRIDPIINSHNTAKKTPLPVHIYNVINTSGRLELTDIAPK